MGLFSALKRPDINTLVAQARADRRACMIDVREEDEYASGHIAGACNIPAERIAMAERFIKDKTAPLYVYCLSGARSSTAATALKRLGYAHVVNMGGINRWQGNLERGRDQS